MNEVDAPAKAWSLDLGATYLGESVTRFRVWAPYHDTLTVELEDKAPVLMQREERGYFSLELEGATPLDFYRYRLPSGAKRPDPVSRALPKGVHGPSQIIDPNAYAWKDQEWSGIDLADAIIYEIHVGTFSEEGTFEGVRKKLDYLADLGVTMIEIMPIAEFPGKWNWGYDGVALYAPYHGYGGVIGFKRLIDHAHQKGIAVCLDVVYNHLGPEGNYLAEFGRYFSDRYQTPWGETFNLDMEHADEVRYYLISNAHYWATEYHIDALRLDAIHGIFDFSAQEMLPLLSEALPIPLIAESALNDARHVCPQEVGGANLGAVWSDDFHHALHVALTGEQQTYYKDYDGFSDLAKTVREGFAYNGCYSDYRKCTYGNDATGVSYEKFVIYNQNHDQTGNRPFGERLIEIAGKQRAICAAYLTLFSPFTPLLFMGEEYGETSPFEYFIDFSDEKLRHAIHQGRQEEFNNDQMPLPGKETFLDSKLTWNQDEELHTLYKQLISIRKEYAPKEGLVVGDVPVYSGPEWVAWEYPTIKGYWIALFCSLGSEQKISLPFQYIRKNQIIHTMQSIDLKQKIFSESEISFLII